MHLVSTGTIGEPVIGLMAFFREQLGIDEITFHKGAACHRPFEGRRVDSSWREARSRDLQAAGNKLLKISFSQ